MGHSALVVVRISTSYGALSVGSGTDFYQLWGTQRWWWYWFLPAMGHSALVVVLISTSYGALSVGSGTDFYLCCILADIMCMGGHPFVKGLAFSFFKFWWNFSYQTYTHVHAHMLTHTHTHTHTRVMWDIFTSVSLVCLSFPLMWTQMEQLKYFDSFMSVLLIFAVVCLFGFFFFFLVLIAVAEFGVVVLCWLRSTPHLHCGSPSCP